MRGEFNQFGFKTRILNTKFPKNNLRIIQKKQFPLQIAQPRRHLDPRICQEQKGVYQALTLTALKDPIEDFHSHV